MSHPPLIYKIADAPLWAKAQAAQRFDGSAHDLRDGFIHFSTAAQARETAAKYFAGQRELLLIAVATDRLGNALKWEPSRGGDLFPHLYAPLPLSAVAWQKPLPVRSDGGHDFPPEMV